MKPLRFSFVLHVHQPVGNFDFVFREHADDVYRPFLDFLEDRELWPIGFHVSGPLLEWLGEHDTDLHDRIGVLAADGKVELLSAGWYEPILASLSPTDRATQLGWMREELEARFGVTPRGLWLTERVWVPELAADLADAGVGYTLVDDHLLRRAGATDAELLRPSRAEHGGRTVGLLAIDERLRYLIPFKPACDVASELRRRHMAGDPLALFADDGEKFGGWPRTREWLYDQGWLAAFGDEMDALRGDGIVRLVTPDAAREELGSGPTFALPQGSYPEMDQWAQGPWINFLDRYREAGRLHTWMSALSDAVREAGDSEALRRAIGRAQCNDAYWHGVFGGLYMKHLREGVRGWMATTERTLRAGETLDWEATTERDGSPAHWVHSGLVSARVTGAAGGTLSELVFLNPEADVTDYITRRLESYHVDAVARGQEDASSAPTDATASIHEIEEGATLERLPPVDPNVRVLVRDRVLGGAVTFGDYRDGEFDALWSSGEAPLVEPERTTVGRARESEDTVGETTEVPAFVWRFGGGAGHAGAGGRAPVFDKSITLSDDRLVVEWAWHAGDLPGDSWFAPELSLGCDVDLSFDPVPEDTWSYPIVTVSKCPDGFEEIEQGRSVTPRWPAALRRARVVLRPMGGR